MFQIQEVTIIISFVSCYVTAMTSVLIITTRYAKGKNNKTFFPLVIDIDLVWNIGCPY